ncbi:helix-turn-helix transcriptional regulator [Kineococcus sp. SYSU DK018]|uniref:helix-turn-helix transcriptional regulator n=1 Tax=Kineococcus sp. SYSU DK018 TaxID=3383139 RepID=UPI003D7D31CF
MEHESTTARNDRDGGGALGADGAVRLAPGSPLSETLTAQAERAGRVVVEDGAGRRFVLVPESRWAALESGGGAPERAPVVLTAREREVLQMVGEGSPCAVVAARLGLALNTVAQHLTSVRRKYGVRTSADAADAARRQGLIG